MIYFIRAGKTENIKIGYTEDKETLKLRIKTLQTGNPYELILEGIIDGDYSDENILHNFFKENRLNGEWFKIPEKICVYKIKRIIIERKYKSRKILLKKQSKTLLHETKSKTKKAIYKLLKTNQFIYSGNISEIAKIDKKDVKKHKPFFKDLIDAHNEYYHSTKNFTEYINNSNIKLINSAITELKKNNQKITNVNISKKTGLHVNTVSNNRTHKTF